MFYPKVDKRRVLPSTTIAEKRRRKKRRADRMWKQTLERLEQRRVRDDARQKEQCRREHIQEIAGQIYRLATDVPSVRDLRRLAEFVTEEFGIHEGGAIATELRWAANTIERRRRWRSMP